MTDDDGRHAPSPRVVAAVVAALLVVAAVVVATVAVAGQQTPPSPPPSAAPRTSSATTASSRGASPSGTTTPARQASARPSGPVLARSKPVSLTVPRLGLRSTTLVHLGLAEDGSIQVPPTGKDSPPSWFTGSPTPGELGPSVILGHVDSAAAGPAVFFRLGAMRPGDSVTVQRADGTDAVFTVDRVEEYAKAKFPTLRVFGNTERAELRLITCGGRFDPRKHSYESNIVVYAHLTGSHPA